MLKALLIALLEPTELLRQYEAAGDFTAGWRCWKKRRRCRRGGVGLLLLRQGCPSERLGWMSVQDYEREVLAKRH